MLYYTHLAFGFLLGLSGIRYFNIQNQILFIILVLFAALLPDIDSPNSKLGSKIKVISLFFKHRGILHSLLILPLIYLVLFYFDYSRFALPLLIGYLSHLIGDSITKEGIMLFSPFSKFKIKGFIKTGGITEHITFILLVFISGFYLLQS